MKNFIIFILFMVVATKGYAQQLKEKPPYKRAVGIRISPIGYSYDFAMISYKMFFTRRGALEINAGVGKEFQRTDYSYRMDGKITGIESHPLIAAISYQLHIPMTRGMAFIIGGAASIMRKNVYNSHTVTDSSNQIIMQDVLTKESYVGIGIGPVGGFDYKFNKIPLNITLDHRPAFLNINRKNDGEISLLNIALAARYTF